jgi:signal transduction histidine kinase
MWQFRVYFYVGLVVQVPVTFKLWYLDDGPGPGHPVFWLRLALGVGLAVTGLRLTRSARAEQWVEWFLFGYVLVIGMALELVYLDLRNGWVHLAVFLPAALLLPRLRFLPAVGIAVALHGWHVVVGLARPDSPGTQLGQSLPWTALIAAFLLTGVYMVEHSARRDFLLVRLLHQERFASLIEGERHRIQRDLHDGAQQGLVAATMWLDVLDATMPRRRSAGTREAMEQLAAALSAVVRELREFTHGGIPSTLENEGLDAALAALVARAPRVVRFEGGSRPDLPLPIACAAYFAAAEGLTNAARHSGAQEISVLVNQTSQGLTIEVRDNGCGRASFGRGSGLTGLRERVAEQGGTLTLDSRVGSGTALRAVFPSGALPC